MDKYYSSHAHGNDYDKFSQARWEMVEEQIREMEQPEEPLEPVEETPGEADEQVEELVEEAPVGEVEPGAGLESYEPEAEVKPEDSEEAPASEDAAQDSE